MLPASDTAATRAVVHASTVAFGRQAVLIRGCSGSGKSGLALQLMALGAQLVSDDRTELVRHDDLILTLPPETIRGRIEARGLGILAADPAVNVPLRLIVDLDQTEDARLPPFRQEQVMGVSVDLIRKSSSAHFPAAIKLYLTGNRIA